MSDDPPAREDERTFTDPGKLCDAIQAILDDPHVNDEAALRAIAALLQLLR